MRSLLPILAIVAVAAALVALIGDGGTVWPPF